MSILAGHLGMQACFDRLIWGTVTAVPDVIDFCLTDVNTSPSARLSALHTFLERKYPFPSRFGATPNQQATIGPRRATERTTS